MRFVALTPAGVFEECGWKYFICPYRRDQVGCADDRRIETSLFPRSHPSALGRRHRNKGDGGNGGLH